MKIYIDGLLVKELRNGEIYFKVLDNGKHYLYCDTFLMNRTQSFEFIGNNNKIEYFVQFPLRRVPCVENSVAITTLLVNKTLETQPGTYDGSELPIEANSFSMYGTDNSISNAAGSSNITYGKIRHGFTTFWLVFQAIIYAIGAVMFIFVPRPYETDTESLLTGYNSLVSLFALS